MLVVLQERARLGRHERKGDNGGDVHMDEDIQVDRLSRSRESSVHDCIPRSYIF
jgi:hypothetical protein